MTTDPIVHYQALHPLAEVSGQEQRTAHYVADALRALGIDCTEQVGGFDVLGVIDSGKPGPTVLFRADMDALPFFNDDGSCTAVHACGHDAHSAMLLAAAARLPGLIKRGRVKLMFQPAEENLTGALAMIRAGALDDVDFAIGAHIRPIGEMPAGCMSARVLHVACATIRVRFTGVTAHAARPHQGINPIDMAAQYIAMVHAIALDPTVAWSVKPTRIAGEPGPTNSISAWTEVTFDLRSQTNAVLTQMLNRMQAMAESVAQAFGAQMHWEQLDYCPGCDDDSELVQVVRECIIETVGKDRLVEAVSAGGEDFHFIKTECPQVRTAYFDVGVGAQPGLHKRDMQFDAQYLQLGVDVWCRLCRKLLGS